MYIDFNLSIYTQIFIVCNCITIYNLFNIAQPRSVDPIGIFVHPTSENGDFNFPERGFMHYGAVTSQIQPSFFKEPFSKVVWNIEGLDGDETDFDIHVFENNAPRSLVEYTKAEDEAFFR